MLDGRAISLTAEPAPPFPVDALLLGKSCDDVAALLPRLFNLCRSAQAMAVRLALGLPADPEITPLRQEILRDHVLRLTVVLPGHFGLGPTALQAGWQEGGSELKKTLFGSSGALPTSLDEFDAYMNAGNGIGGLWQRIGDLFEPGEAISGNLPYVTTTTAGTPSALVENTCAARVAEHPVVRGLQDRTGRGPLWRVVARSYDLEAVLDGAPLFARSPEPGVAHVPATRGMYSVNARAEAGIVTSFSRVTPTDHLQVPGGVLDQTLANLSVTRSGLVSLVMDILDPCSPIRVREMADA